MKKYIPLILSITSHLIIIVVINITIKDRAIVSEDEQKIRIELIAKKIKKENSKEIIYDKDADIFTRVNSNIDQNSKQPDKSSYINIDHTINPELIISQREERNDLVSFDNINDLNDFENSLNDLILTQDIYTEEEDDNLSITWDNNSREIIKSIDIDFSMFPSETFTGVGIKVEFNVNQKGEVFDILIIPPGSGSTEFDIRIKQYVSRFTFNKSSENSKGDLIIVYR